MDFCWLNSGTALGMGCTDGSMRIFEYPSLKELYSETSHYGQCNTLDQHPRGKYVCRLCTLTRILTLKSYSYIATGGNDAILAIWDMKEWMCVRTCSPYEYARKP
jgi:THO complex subunit 3